MVAAKEKKIHTETITDNFNYKTGTYRDLNYVKIKYEDIKRNLKKILEYRIQKSTAGDPELKTDFLWHKEPSVGDSDSVWIGADNESILNDTIIPSNVQNTCVV